MIFTGTIFNGVEEAWEVYAIDLLNLLITPLADEISEYWRSSALSGVVLAVYEAVVPSIMLFCNIVWSLASWTCTLMYADAEPMAGICPDVVS